MCQLHYTVKTFLNSNPTLVASLLGANNYFYDGDGNIVKEDTPFKLEYLILCYILVVVCIFTILRKKFGVLSQNVLFEKPLRLLI